MINLHEVQPSIPIEIVRAAAVLNRSHRSIGRFRLTENPYTGRSGDYTSPVEYFYGGRWDRWTNHSLARYAMPAYHVQPSEAEVAAAWNMFEAPVP